MTTPPQAGPGPLAHGTLPLEPDVGLAYARAGSGGTPLLVPALSWLGLDLGALAAGRAVVFHDVRGRGRSSRVDDPARLSLARDVQDLERLRAHLAASDPAFERVDLLGWSYYGALALHHALAHPDRVRRIVLVGPSPPRSKPWFGRFLDAFAQRMDLGLLNALERDRRGGLRERDPLAYGRRVHDLFHRAYVADPAVLARMRSDPCVPPNEDADRVNDQSRRVIEALGDYDWRDEARALDLPVLLLHGSEDPVPLAGSEEWASVLPDCRLEVLEGVGHMPWLEAPEDFLARVRTFLGAAS